MTANGLAAVAVVVVDVVIVHYYLKKSFYSDPLCEHNFKPRNIN